MSRGRHAAASADSSAARSGTVPTIVPSAYTVPPNCSVKSIAVPPHSAADNMRNGKAFNGGHDRRNKARDRHRKHGSFQYGMRRTGIATSDASAYAAPISETTIVGAMRIRAPIHAAASR